jgi:carbon starvation protein CstA
MMIVCIDMVSIMNLITHVVVVFNFSKKIYYQIKIIPTSFFTCHTFSDRVQYSCFKLSNNMNTEHVWDFCSIDVNFILINQKVVWFKSSLSVYFMNDNMKEFSRSLKKRQYNLSLTENLNCVVSFLCKILKNILKKTIIVWFIIFLPLVLFKFSMDSSLYLYFGCIRVYVYQLTFFTSKESKRGMNDIIGFFSSSRYPINNILTFQ